MSCSRADPISCCQAAISGAELVVHAAGPFQRKGNCAVLEAAIDLRVPYVDVCDDSEYAEQTKSLHQRAAEAGVPCITSAGIYPGGCCNMSDQFGAESFVASPDTSCSSLHTSVLLPLKCFLFEPIILLRAEVSVCLVHWHAIRPFKRIRLTYMPTPEYLPVQSRGIENSAAIASALLVRVQLPQTLSTLDHVPELLFLLSLPGPVLALLPESLHALGCGQAPAT